MATSIITREPVKLTPLLERHLASRSETFMLQPARSAGLTLPIVGVSRRPTRPELVTIGETPWLLADALNDPLTKSSGGGQLIPADQRERLIALMQAGVKPDLTWIAHELPAGTTLETLDQVPAPKKSRVKQMDDRLGKTIASVGKAGKYAALGAALAPFAAVGLLLAPLSVDPIIFGGVLSSDGELVAWAELARWDVVF